MKQNCLFQTVVDWFSGRHYPESKQMRNVSSGFFPEQRQMKRLPHSLFSEESFHQVTQANTECLQYPWALASVKQFFFA